MELPLSQIRTEELKNLYHAPGVSVSVLRLDEIDTRISGNKWFKLRFYLQRALQEKKSGLLTFGGAWSNHILATAAACRMAGCSSAGIIRGERPRQLSATLQEAAQLGMELHFSSRSDYARKALPPELANADDWLLVPEGGHGAEGVAGAALIASTTDWRSYTHILMAVGTGTTLAGLITAVAPAGIACIGINALRNKAAEAEVAALLPQALHASISILDGYEFGGYARHPSPLLDFMNDWFRRTQIPSDIVYTGKLFYAADALIGQGYFPRGSRLLIVHSGGLQGNRSLTPGTLIF